MIFFLCLFLNSFGFVAVLMGRT